MMIIFQNKIINNKISRYLDADLVVSVPKVVLGDGLEAVAAPADVHPPHPRHYLTHVPAEQRGPGLACTVHMVLVQYSISLENNGGWGLDRQYY